MPRPGRTDHLPVSQSVSVPVSPEVNRLIGIGGPVVPGLPGLLTLLAAYRLVFGSWWLQDGPQEATALRFWCILSGRGTG